MSGYTFHWADYPDSLFGVRVGELQDGADPDQLPDLWITVPEYRVGSGSQDYRGAVFVFASSDLSEADTLGGGLADGIIDVASLFAPGSDKLLQDSYLILGPDSFAGPALEVGSLGDIDGDGAAEYFLLDELATATVYIFDPNDFVATDGIVSTDAIDGDSLTLAIDEPQHVLTGFAPGAADLDGDTTGDLVAVVRDEQGPSIEVSVISGEDIAGLALSGTLDLGTLSPAVAPSSWTFETGNSTGYWHEATADFVQIAASGPAQLAINTSGSDDGAPYGGAIYLLDLSDPDQLADADAHDMSSDHRISLDGIEARLDNSYKIVSTTDYAGLTLLGALGDLDEDGLSELLVMTQWGSATLHVLSSRDFAAADATDGTDRVVAVESFAGLTYSYRIEQAPASMDSLAWGQRAPGDHDGDGAADIIATNWTTDGASVVLLSSGSLAPEDNGIVHVDDVAGRPGSVEIRISGTYVMNTASLGDLDGDGRSELAITVSFSDEAGQPESRTHIVYSGDLPDRGVVDLDPLTGAIMPVCFAAGTRIATPRGDVAVERLVPGDLVLTRDHGPQPVRWIGRRHLTAAEIAAEPRFAPVRIAAGALGRGLPRRDLTVSPQHRMLLTGPVARRIGGAPEILVAAKHLCGLPGISTTATPGGIDYLHLLFDRHEIVLAESAPAESLHTGPMALSSLSPDARAEIFTLFPDLARGEQRPTARPVPPGRAARRIVRQRPLASPLIA